MGEGHGQHIDGVGVLGLPQWVPGTRRVLSPLVKEQEELLLGAAFVAILGKGSALVPTVTKELFRRGSAWPSLWTR